METAPLLPPNPSATIEKASRISVSGMGAEQSLRPGMAVTTRPGLLPLRENPDAAAQANSGFFSKNGWPSVQVRAAVRFLPAGVTPPRLCRPPTVSIAGRCEPAAPSIAGRFEPIAPCRGQRINPPRLCRPPTVSIAGRCEPAALSIACRCEPLALCRGCA